MKESELFEPVKKLLLDIGCEKVYGEVGSCDVLGIQGASNFIVELKVSLSFKVIDQAMDRLRVGHYVYIAIPKRKNPIPNCVKHLLQTYKIGLIEVGKRSTKVSIPARFNRIANKRKAYKRIRRLIKPYSESQIGGVKSGECVSDYSVTIDNIKSYMRRKDWVTVDEILEHCETHYKQAKTSVMATLKSNWNKDWCETKKEDKVTFFRMKEV